MRSHYSGMRWAGYGQGDVRVYVRVSIITVETIAPSRRSPFCTCAGRPTASISRRGRSASEGRSSTPLGGGGRPRGRPCRLTASDMRGRIAHRARPSARRPRGPSTRRRRGRWRGRRPRRRSTRRSRTWTSCLASRGGSGRQRAASEDGVKTVFGSGLDQVLARVWIGFGGSAGARVGAVAGCESGVCSHTPPRLG